MNYSTVVNWDPNVIDVCFMDADTAPTNLQGLAKEGVYTVTGVPVATSGKWIPSAKIYNAIDSTWYINSGSTASPVWTLVSSGGGSFTLPKVVTDSTTTGGVSFSITDSVMDDGDAMHIHAPNLSKGNIFVAESGVSAPTSGGSYFKAISDNNIVFRVGGGGKIYSNQMTPPTIAVNTANGITAAAVASGSTDVCGSVSTTGTNNNAGDTLLVLTFNGAYDTTPKLVIVTGTNHSGSTSGVYVGVRSINAFTFDIPASSTAGANPSFNYLVIA